MTPRNLIRASLAGQCVVWLSGRHMPAAFLIGMPFRSVMNAMPRIKTYKPKKKHEHRNQRA